MADAYFTLVIEFKDNRIRIFAPEIKHLMNNYGVEILYICKKTSPLTHHLMLFAFEVGDLFDSVKVN